MPAVVSAGLRRAALAIARRLGVRPATPEAWLAELRGVRWLDSGALELTGWARDDAVDYTGALTTITLVARRRRRGLPAVVRASVEVVPSPEANQVFNGATADADYSTTCFRAVLPAAPLLRGGGRWDVSVGIRIPAAAAGGGFTKRYALGSASYLSARAFGDRVVVPEWNKGLSLVVRAGAPLAAAVARHGDELVVGLAGAAPAAARLVVPGGTRPLTVDPATGELRGSWPEPAGGDWRVPQPGVWDAAPAGDGSDIEVPYRHLRVEVAGGDGDYRPVLLAGEVATAGVEVEPGPDSELRIVDSPAHVVVDSAELLGGAEPVVRLGGRLVGLGSVRLKLAGQNESRSTAVEADATGGFSADIPMLASRWGQPPLPPQIGRFLLLGLDPDGREVAVRAAAPLIERAGESVLCDWFRLYFAVARGRVLALRLGIPFTEDEIGTHQQARLKATFDGGGFPLADQAYFESFYGRICTCNPRALNDTMALEYPGVPRFWAVRDYSVAVPEGTTAVADGTTGWWRARGASRWIITNDWMRARFQPRPGQTVLQTWHGTMYKRIGLDRDQIDPGHRAEMLQERAKWTVMLSQNPHHTHVFRTAYPWDGPTYEEGYPRNDILATGSRDAEIRARLGIPAGVTTVLYAPTWRDDRPEQVDFLDVNRFAAALGDGYRVMLRGHSRTLRIAQSVRTDARVLDVTTYPDTAELLAATDILLTDYSSIMFDFSVTGRPMVFFTPDLAEYRDVTRGVYFDLEATAPGPVVFTQDDAVAAIRSAGTDGPRFAGRYDTWRATYNPWDDGSSGSRVLRRLFADTPPEDPCVLTGA